MRVLVLGAGLLGTTSAWYLRQAGHEVTVLDRPPGPALETSFANGSQISVSHAEPWANPHVLPKALAWLGKEDAPLLFRPRWDPALFRWTLAFLREPFCRGHSGMDIHKGLGNANKIMNRLLFDGFENFGLQISEISGGSLRNAIPRESVAKVIVAAMYDEAFVFDMQEVICDIKAEFKTMEPNLTIEIEKSDLPAKVMDLGVQEGLLRAIYAAHNGVYRMSADMPDLVETSNNIARVIVKDGEISIQNLTRSSVESSKFDLANALRSAYELFGCEVEFGGSYPGWTPNVNSEILNLLVQIYEKQNGSKPSVVACHAGLECYFGH